MRIVLVPGAGGVASFWHRVVPILADAGHDPRAVDLPGDDETAGLDTYCELVLAAVAPPTVVVAQSMGGFTAAMVAARTELAQLMFVNAMIPAPGETPEQWWTNVGHEAARVAAARAAGYAIDFDVDTYFLHDVSREELPEHRDEAAAAFASPCRFEAWPQIPIRVLAGEDDRFFPIALQRRVARERLGRPVEPVPGGHLNALSHPRELATAILASIP